MSAMLCIDGLPLDLSSKQLRALAEVHGHVIRCWVVKAPGSDISLRFGYIEAATALDAERMMAGLSSKKVNCKPCTVDVEQTSWPL